MLEKHALSQTSPRFRVNIRALNVNYVYNPPPSPPPFYRQRYFWWGFGAGFFVCFFITATTTDHTLLQWAFDRLLNRLGF